MRGFNFENEARALSPLDYFPPRFTIFYEVNCMLYDNILETIGKTPLVKLNSISYDDVNVFGNWNISIRRAA